MNHLLQYHDRFITRPQLGWDAWQPFKPNIYFHDYTTGIDQTASCTTHFQIATLEQRVVQRQGVDDPIFIHEFYIRITLGSTVELVAEDSDAVDSPAVLEVTLKLVWCRLVVNLTHIPKVQSRDQSQCIFIRIAYRLCNKRWQILGQMPCGASVLAMSTSPQIP